MKSLAKVKKIIRLLYLTGRHTITYPDFSFRKKETPEVVFCVNGWIGHGGWADRLKGAISTFQFCKENNLKFKIWYTFPTDLSKFLTPRTAHFKCSQNDLRFNPFLDKVACYTDSLQGVSLSKKIGNGKFRKAFVYYNLDDVVDPYMLSSLFSEMFTINISFSNDLQRKLDEFPKPWYGVVLRFLGLFGDFMRSQSSLNGSARKKALRYYCEHLEMFCKSRGLLEKGTIFLFSDSDFFIQQATTHIPIRTLYPLSRRKFIHQKMESDDADETMKRTLLDFIALSRMESVFLFVDGKYLWRSGFARYARYVFNRDDVEIVRIGHFK